MVDHRRRINPRIRDFGHIVMSRQRLPQQPERRPVAAEVWGLLLSIRTITQLHDPEVGFSLEYWVRYPPQHVPAHRLVDLLIGHANTSLKAGNGTSSDRSHQRLRQPWKPRMGSVMVTATAPSRRRRQARSLRILHMVSIPSS